MKQIKKTLRMLSIRKETLMKILQVKSIKLKHIRYVNNL